MTGDFAGYEEHYIWLGKVAYLVTGDMDTARDLAHEALVRSVEHGWDLRAPASRAYLRAIALNLWRRRLRRATTEKRAYERILETPREDMQLNVSDQEVVWSAILSLSVKQRVCLVLRYYEGMTGPEIADLLRVPAGTVKSHLSRGLRSMAKQLGETL